MSLETIPIINYNYEENLEDIVNKTVLEEVEKRIKNIIRN